MVCHLDLIPPRKSRALPHNPKLPAASYEPAFPPETRLDWLSHGNEARRVCFLRRAVSQFSDLAADCRMVLLLARIVLRIGAG
jgi:hypothetical protein